MSRVLVYIASLAGLERPYIRRRMLSNTDQKAVVLSKNEGEYLYQFYGREEDKAVYFTVLLHL